MKKKKKFVLNYVRFNYFYNENNYTSISGKLIVVYVTNNVFLSILLLYY